MLLWQMTIVQRGLDQVARIVWVKVLLSIEVRDAKVGSEAVELVHEHVIQCQDLPQGTSDVVDDEGNGKSEHLLGSGAVYASLEAVEVILFFCFVVRVSTRARNRLRGKVGGVRGVGAHEAARRRGELRA